MDKTHQSSIFRGKTFQDLMKLPFDIEIQHSNANLDVSLTEVYGEHQQQVFNFEVSSKTPVFPKPITLRWKVRGCNVKGVWKPTADFSKRIQADWELEQLVSRISVDAPVISLFGNDDSNILTFACSNAINTLKLNARYREEDNCFYCHMEFFPETEQPIERFSAQLRIDTRELHFSKALGAVASWWEGFGHLKPAYVPAIAKKPLYSTWYQFHQKLDLGLLQKECAIAFDLGYRAVIIDDGWQTNDTDRGYDFTGDWEPERITDMAKYVKKLQQLGMKVALWYSVPFCGEKSRAYQKFKGKFLTEKHRWAPVLDPRYPEVRDYLVQTYKKALENWNLDGFKLDFIDDFRLYEDTPLGQENGRDFASINAAVDFLMTEIIHVLRAMNPEVFIEFRQKYIGPAMRKYGNMLRAFDCPGDATMNRVRIADIKMLCGDTAVHADMITWHSEESVEVAALQLISTLFGVPQLSVLLQNLPHSHLEMIRFYTAYWNTYSDVLLQGDFVPYRPLANYPLQSVQKDGILIIGVFDAFVVPLHHAAPVVHLLNGQLKNELVLRCGGNFGSYHVTCHDCQGNVTSDQNIELIKGVTVIEIPPCGLAILTSLDF